MEQAIGMHLESVAVIMHLIGATLKFSNQRFSVVCIKSFVLLTIFYNFIMKGGSYFII